MNKFKKSNKQLGIFITAGFPQLDSLPKQLNILEAAQVDFIEVGMPFSDPMADGPTIQQSSEIALSNGMHLELMFEQLEQTSCVTPVVLMGYLNPVLHYGLEKFLARCQKLNISGVLLPDISIEIYQRFYKASFEKYGVNCIFIITESTPSSRRQLIASESQNGFIYLTSSIKTTGVQNEFNVMSEEVIADIRKDINEVPLMIGFGIKSKSDIQKVHELADGAIIGSAYIKAATADACEAYLESLA